ncbi:MAG: undecaprenyl-phosphate galactose phosphotransferase WbaP [Calditerrivibrio sp.]|nr:undecaprenyl-phosphate galactose phosphotransferase WbaP [Calditerrivibrio sp.]
MGIVGVLPTLQTDFNFLLSIYWVILSLMVLLMLFEGLYFRVIPFWEEAKKISKIVTIWVLLIFTILSLTKKVNEFSRAILLFMWFYSLFLFPVVHLLMKKIFSRFKFFKIPAIIVGNGNDLINLSYALFRHDYLCYDIHGLFTDSLPKEHITIDNTKISVLGKKLEAIEYLSKNKVDTVFLMEENLHDDQQLLYKLHNKINNLILVPNFKQIPVKNSEIVFLLEQAIFMLKLKNNLKFITNLLIKRLFDIILSLILLPILLVIIVLIAILIKIDSRGPVFYKHIRIGKNGSRVPVLKFRTMYIDAKERLNKLLEQDEELKKEWETSYKLKNDPRVTKIGKFLRKTSLDELPQIFNVLKGEMSLVGPRPVTEEELERYYKDKAEYYYMVPPGITGLWQVSGRSDTSYEFRVWLDSWYVMNWSLWLDIVILFKTVKTVLKKEGAY